MERAIKYSLTVCLISWAAVDLAHFGFDLTKESAWYNIFAVAYMFLPMITAIVTQCFKKEKFNHTGLVSFKLSWGWLVAWLLPVAIVLLCIPVNGLFPGVETGYNAEQLIRQYHIPEGQQELIREQMGKIPGGVMMLIIIFSGLIAGITINAVAAFGEEYGWRNYLVSTLREVKFWKAALFIGFVWGIWHLPLILMGHNYPNEPQWGVLLMIVVCILMGVIELYFVLKTKSMIVAAIMHGTFNAVAGVNIFFISGGNDFLNGIQGLAGFIIMAVTIVCIYIYDTYISRERLCSNTLKESLERI